MYEALDPFLRRSTWHTTHSLDDKAFYLALSDIVYDKSFSPEAMRAYMKSFLGGDAAQYSDEIENRVEQASIISDFLRHTSRL